MPERHSRAIELEAGYNFRDLGGYATKSGRSIVWRRLFRSGKLSDLTPGDRAVIRDLEIKSVIDFRRLPERNDAPSLWHDGHKPYVATHPHPNDMAENAASLFGQLIYDNVPAKDLMLQVYREMPEDYAAHYAEMFRLLADEAETPLLFHCTGGKDRTGLAAYLILHLLGVDEQTILEDYLLTNILYPADDRLMKLVERAITTFKLDNADPEQFRPIVGVEEDYLRTALEQIRKEFGSVDGYIEERLGVTADTRNKIQENLLV